MTCVFCKGAYPPEVNEGTEERGFDSAGGFVWSKNAPIAYWGVVVCPDCMRTLEVVPILRQTNE